MGRGEPDIPAPAANPPGDGDSGGDEPAIIPIPSEVIAEAATRVTEIAFARAARAGFIPQPEEPGTIANRVYLAIFGGSEDVKKPLGRKIRAEVARAARPVTITADLEVAVVELTRQIIKDCQDAERHRVLWRVMPPAGESGAAARKLRLPYNVHLGGQDDIAAARDDVAEREAAIDLCEALEALPELGRAVIRLYLENLSTSEISDRTGLRPRTIRRLRAEAVSALAARLRGDGKRVGC